MNTKDFTKLTKKQIDKLLVKCCLNFYEELKIMVRNTKIMVIMKIIKNHGQQTRKS